MSEQTSLIEALPDWMTKAQKDALYSLAARAHGLRHEMDVIEDILRRLDAGTPRYDRYMVSYNTQREKLLRVKARMDELRHHSQPSARARFWHSEG